MPMTDKKALTCLLFLALASVVFAAGNVVQSTDAISVPRLINYQGKLTDGTGTPVPDGNYTVDFAVYAESLAGTALWTERRTVQTANGLFNVILGATSAVVIPDGPGCFLQVTVNGALIAPRVRMASTPYSYNAQAAQEAAHATNADAAVSAGQATNADNATNADHATNADNADQATNADNASNADRLDGNQASAFAQAAHPHSGADITSGKVGNAYLNTGTGGGLDADQLDGNHASAFTTVTNDAGRSGVVTSLYEGTSALASKYAAIAHPHSGADINSGKVGNAYLNTGTGNGLDADLLDGNQASAFALSSHNHDAAYLNDGGGEINATNDFNFTAPTQITNLGADLLDGSHASAFAASAHAHSGADITSGTVPDARLSANVDLLNSPQTISATKTFSAQQAFTYAGAPFTVANATAVTNLNADQLDGSHSSAFATSAHTHTATGDVTGTLSGALTIANNAVASLEIADGTITSTDIATNAITFDKIARGAVSGQALVANGATTDANWDYPTALGRAANTPTAVTFLRFGTVAFPAAAAVPGGTTRECVVPLVNAAIGDKLFVSVNSAGVWPAGLILGAHCIVNAAGQFTVRIANVTAGNLTPGATTLEYIWLR